METEQLSRAEDYRRGYLAGVSAGWQEGYEQALLDQGKKTVPTEDTEKPCKCGFCEPEKGLEPLCDSAQESSSSRDFFAVADFGYMRLKVIDDYLSLGETSEFRYAVSEPLERAIPKLRFILRAAELAQERTWVV